MSNHHHRLKKLEAQARPGTPFRPCLVEYSYPATATAEEREAAKADALACYQADHPELEGRRVPIITLGLAQGDIKMPAEEEKL